MTKRKMNPLPRGGARERTNKPKYGEHTVSINVTLPPNLIKAAEAIGPNRSAGIVKLMQLGEQAMSKQEAKNQLIESAITALVVNGNKMIGDTMTSDDVIAIKSAAYELQSQLREQIKYDEFDLFDPKHQAAA